MPPFIKRIALATGLNTLHFSGLTRLPQLARRGIGVVLTLHHVGPMEPDPFDPNRGLTVTPEFLDQALGWIRAKGYDLVPLDEVHRRLTSGKAGRPFAAITLDDGYRDNRDAALPVFERHKAPFTIFVTTGFSEGTTILWWEVLARVLRAATAITFDFGDGPERLATASHSEKCTAWSRFREWVTQSCPRLVLERIGALAKEHDFDALALTRDLVMSVEELTALARHPLVSLGAHTLTHPNLMRLAADEAVAEMRESADRIAAWTGARPRFLAYPYGFRSAAAGDQFRLAAEAGFDMALTTRPGVLVAEHGRHMTALPRISLNGEFQRLRHLDVLMSGAPFVLKNRFRLLDVA